MRRKSELRSSELLTDYARCDRIDFPEGSTCQYAQTLAVVDASEVPTHPHPVAGGGETTTVAR